MALLKLVVAPNGVPLQYHRITDISIITNELNIIRVSSYISEEERQKEIDWLEEQRASELDGFQEISVYIDSSDFSTSYDQYMSIQSAYEYLKTLPEFEDAEDC